MDRYGTDNKPTCYGRGGASSRLDAGSDISARGEKRCATGDCEPSAAFPRNAALFGNLEDRYVAVSVALKAAEEPNGRFKLHSGRWRGMLTAVTRSAALDPERTVATVARSR
jgi:hypothetical protein